MRRFAALVLVHTLVASTTIGASLHVHEYVDHDHPEHHHGPASHEHEGSARAHHPPQSESEGHPVLEAASCDPGQHAVVITMSCAQVPQAHVEIAVLPGPPILPTSAPVGSASAISDVRVHGPPCHTRALSRAPPLYPHA